MKNQKSVFTEELDVNTSTVEMSISSNATQNQSVENLSSVIKTSNNALRPVLPPSSVGLTGYVSPRANSAVSESSASKEAKLSWEKNNCFH